MPRSTLYTFLFAGAVCVVCAILVSSAAVSLSELQDNNVKFDKQKNVLYAAGLADPQSPPTREDVDRLFENIKAVAVELETGNEAPEIDAETFDQVAAAADPDQSRPAPPNPSSIKRLPHHAVVYKVLADDGRLRLLVLPIEGYGLWSTLYGFLALDADLTTIRGITYYDHGETPGLGGEVDNPRWKALWNGRIAFDENGEPEIEVIKGRAGPPEQDPHRVDGLSGATLTSRGVTNMLRFWLGDTGFRPYLIRLRESGQIS